MDLNSDESGNETDAYGKKSDDECVVLEVNAPRKRRRKRLTPLPKGHKSAARRRPVASTVPSTPAPASNPPTATTTTAVPSGLALLTAAAATAATALRSVPQPPTSASKQAMPAKKVSTGRPRGRPRKHPPVENPPPPPADDMPDSDEAASNTESEYEGDDPESRRQRRTIRRNRRCIKDATERRRFDQLNVVDQLTYRPTRDRSWKGPPRFNIATMRGRRGNLHRSYDQKHSEDVDESEGLQLVRDEFGGSPKSTASWADTDEDHVEEKPTKKPKREASSVPRSRPSPLSSILATVPPPSCPSPGPAPHLLDVDTAAGPSDADSWMDAFADDPGPVSTPTANQPVDDQTPVSNAPPDANLATPKIAYARWRKYTAPQRIDNLSPSLPSSSSSLPPPPPPAAAATTNVVVGVPAQAPLPHPNLDEIIRRPRPVPPPPPVQRSSSTTRTTTTTTTTTTTNTTNRPLGLKWETKSSLELAESARRELEAQVRREKPPTYFDKNFKSSQPCRYGSMCRYKNTGCAFVHPHQDDRKRKLEDTGSSSSSGMRREPMNQAPGAPQDVKRYVWRPPLPNHGFSRKTFELYNKVERDANGNVLKPFHETARF